MASFGRPLSMPNLLGHNAYDDHDAPERKPPDNSRRQNRFNWRNSRLFRASSSAIKSPKRNSSRSRRHSVGLDSGVSSLVSNGGPAISDGRKGVLYKETCAAVTNYNKRYHGQKFPISQPSKDDLIFSGVVSITWRDDHINTMPILNEGDVQGELIHTKSLLINSITTVRSIINQCVGKFHLPGSSLTYGLYELNEHTRTERRLHEEDRPLVLLVYGDSANQSLTFRLKSDCDASDKRVVLRNRRERQLELDLQRGVIQNKLKGIVPINTVTDGGIVTIELELDSCLVHLSAISKQAQSALLGLVKVIVDNTGNTSNTSITLAHRLELWELLRPFATQVVFHVRQLVADTHEIVSQHCTSNTCSLMATNHLNVLADMAKEVVHACKDVGGCGDSAIPYDKAVAGLGKQADNMRLLVHQCREIVLVCCINAQLLRNCAEWLNDKPVLPESLYETPPVISDSIMFTVAVAYSRLIQTSFEERLDDLTDVAADLVQPTQLILQVVHSSPDYNLLQASPLYTRLSKLEEILKGDISRLFKLVRQSTHVSAPIGTMSTMLLGAFVVVKDCSQLLIAAQCSNVLNSTVLTGWQLLRMTWFSSWLQEQQALNNSDTSSSTLHIPAILVPSSNMHSKAQSVASSGFGSLTALNSESELEGPGGRTSKVQAGSLSKRRLDHDYPILAGGTEDEDDADEDKSLAQSHSASNLVQSKLPTNLRSNISQSMHNVSSLPVTAETVSSLPREVFRTPQAVPRHAKSINPSATTGRLMSSYGLSKSRQSIISTGSDRSLHFNRQTSRISMDWSDVYNSRIKAAASMESLRAYRSPISEAGLSISRPNLLTSDSEDTPGRHGIARRRTASRPSSGRASNANQAPGTMGKLQKMEHNLSVNTAVGKVLENILFSLRQKISQLEAELNSKEDHSEIPDSHVHTATRPIIDAIGLLVDEASALELDPSEVSSHFSQVQTLAQVTCHQLLTAVRASISNGREVWLAKVSSLLAQTRTACFDMVSAALKIISSSKDAIEEFRKTKNIPANSQPEAATTHVKRRPSRLNAAEDREDDELIFEDAPVLRSMGKDPRRVKAGTISRLVQRLTYHKVVDTEFAQVFYTTFHLFTTPELFLDELVARFNSQAPDDVDKQEYIMSVIIPVQLRVCSAIRAWLKYDGTTLVGQQGFLHLLLDVERMFPSCHRQILVLIRKCNAYASLKSTDTGASSGNTPGRRRMTRIPQVQHTTDPKARLQMEERAYSDREGDDDFNELKTITEVEKDASQQVTALLSFHDEPARQQPADVIARALTLLDWKFFQSVSRKEWFAAARRKEALNFDKFLNHSAEISACVGKAIVETTDTENAATCLRFYVNIAQSLLDLHNYHSLYMVVSALVLKLGEERVESDMMDSKNGAAALVELVKFCSYANNYAVYREALDANRDKFAIPILGVVIADMQAVEENQSDTLGQDTDTSCSRASSSDLINIQKFRAISAIYRSVSNLQANSAQSIKEQPVAAL